MRMQEAPVPPKDRKHFHHPTKRGSITFPGHAALSAVSDWLTVLVPAMTWAKFPASGMSLVSNLVQLLFCHCEKQSGRPADAAEPESSDIIADAFSLPGQIQVEPWADTAPLHVADASLLDSSALWTCTLKLRYMHLSM